jgi:hypothetical protein
MGILAMATCRRMPGLNAVELTVTDAGGDGFRTYFGLDQTLDVVMRMVGRADAPAAGRDATTPQDHQRPLFDDVSDDRGPLMVGLVALATFAGICTGPTSSGFVDRTMMDTSPQRLPA